jgi:hypothetical protein
MACMNNNLKLKEVLNFQKCCLLSKCQRKSESRITREIEITATISSRLKPGQEVLQGALQTLHYNLGDMHTLSPNNQEDMAFQR